MEKFNKYEAEELFKTQIEDTYLKNVNYTKEIQTDRKEIEEVLEYIPEEIEETQALATIWEEDGSKAWFTLKNNKWEFSGSKS